MLHLIALRMPTLLHSRGLETHHMSYTLCAGHPSRDHGSGIHTSKLVKRGGFFFGEGLIFVGILESKPKCYKYAANK